MGDPVIAVNTLVRLDFGGAMPLLASRVEEVQGSDLLLSAASHIGIGPAPRPGSTLSVQWTARRGLCSLPAEFRGLEDGALRIWRVRIAGAVALNQRRRFTRVSVGGAISLEATEATEADAGKEPAAVLGWMVNLSEGGVLLRASTGAHPLGTNVRVRVTLDREPIVVEGQVLTLRPTPDAGLEEVVVLFQTDERTADRIRRFVMDQQLQQRRAGLS